MKTYVVLEAQNSKVVVYGTMVTKKLAEELAQKVDPQFDPQKPNSSRIQIIPSSILMPSDIKSVQPA